MCSPLVVRGSFCMPVARTAGDESQWVLHEKSGSLGHKSPFTFKKQAGTVSRYIIKCRASGSGQYFHFARQQNTHLGEGLESGALAMQFQLQCFLCGQCDIKKVSQGSLLGAALTPGSLTYSSYFGCGPMMTGDDVYEQLKSEVLHAVFDIPHPKHTVCEISYQYNSTCEACMSQDSCPSVPTFYLECVCPVSYRRDSAVPGSSAFLQNQVMCVKGIPGCQDPHVEHEVSMATPICRAGNN